MHLTPECFWLMIASIATAVSRGTLRGRRHGHLLTACRCTLRGRSRSAGRQTESPSGELVVWAGGAKPVLAYDVLVKSVRTDQVPSRMHTLVDAKSGATLISYDEVQTGTGDGIFYNASLETKAHTGGGYELTDTHGNNTRDAHNQGDPNTGVGPAGDLFVDGANSKWKDTKARAERAKARGVALPPQRKARPFSAALPVSELIQDETGRRKYCRAGHIVRGLWRRRLARGHVPEGRALHRHAGEALLQRDVPAAGFRRRGTP